MSGYTATMTAYPSSTPNIDLENPHFGITVEWTWPSGPYWSRFQIVRSVRSPVKRVEEGYRMLPLEGWHMDRWEDYSVGTDYDPVTRNPILQDLQPPPGEWVFYTLFVLDSFRVWNRVAYVSEIGPEDHDWALRLPELLPGVSVSLAQGVAHPADQPHDLVQFLQVPGTFLDIGVTMAEAVQYFWDPRRVPSQLLPALVQSWGYRWNETIGIMRNREIMAALREPAQGSMTAISQVATAAMGSPVDVMISNNLMLDVNDSSFEDPHGLFSTNRWQPKDNVEMISYYQGYGPTPVLAPNLLIGYFIKITGTFPRTFYCGYDESMKPQPRLRGIPVAGWSKFRMGCYGFDEPGGAATTLTMGMLFYDSQERYLGDIEAFAAATLDTSAWDWNGNGDEGLAATVPISGLVFEVMPTDALTNASYWKTIGPPAYAGPQGSAPTWVAGSPGHLAIGWSTAPATDAPTAFWGIPHTSLMPTSADPHLEAGTTYQVSLTQQCSTTMSPWRLAISDGTETVAYSDWFTGGESGPESVVSSFEWTCPMVGNYWIGIEVQKPGSDWSGVTPSAITAISMSKSGIAPTYAIPYFTVTGSCCLDLIVVDDG